MDDYTSFINLDKTDANIWYSRGMLHRSFGRFDQALADLNKALELNAQNGLAYLERARAFAHMGKQDLAATDYEKARALGVEKQAYDNELMNK